MNINVEIAKDSNHWNQYNQKIHQIIVEITEKIISRYSNFSQVKELELSILLTNSTKIQSLNNKFRKKNKPTNVLSFPDLEINWRSISSFQPNTDYVYLGDIAFCYEIIKEEAKFKSISFYDHFTHLAIHSILHLLGYDHINEEDAHIMESIEIEVLKFFSISSPY